MDDYDDNDEYGVDKNNRRNGHANNLAAAAAIKLTRNIMTQLACDLNGTDQHSLDEFLRRFNLEDKLCSSRRKVDCTRKSLYRMPSGLCNNLKRPYDGNSHTAFGRLASPAYEDYVSEPRRKSVRGGQLPSCRRISLELGSKPVFNRVFNNHFTIFGQFIAHDTTLAVPVTDTYSTPITSCTCESKFNKDKCTVIDIPDDDPTLGGQKCMAFPATAQAFKDEVCSLGVKEQLNGNSHFIDLSSIYGSTTTMAQALRSDDGLLKSTRRYGTRILPPSQREGKSCSDGTSKYKCFAGGDSRLMINLLFTSIHTTFLRAHNDLATLIKSVFPPVNGNTIYEISRLATIGYFQKVVYADWLSMLLGPTYQDTFNALTRFTRTTYSSETKPVVFNEVATAAFRLHTLVRDLFSRCTPDGTRIDQLWLHDILHKVKYAYDIENYSLDSLLCGSFYDYGFNFDGNFAHQIHHRLFETVNSYGSLWRNDLAAINICRGREHGIPPFTKFWNRSTNKKAKDFKDLGYTINYSGIKLLKKVYKDVDDIDLFVGLNMEDPVPGAIVGPTSVYILRKQFDVLRDGDRFFYSHETSGLSPVCAIGLRLYPYRCFICSESEMQSVPYNPFKPPSHKNPLVKCNKCLVEFNLYVLLMCTPPSDPTVLKLQQRILYYFYLEHEKELKERILSVLPSSLSKDYPSAQYPGVPKGMNPMVPPKETKPVVPPTGSASEPILSQAQFAAMLAELTLLPSGDVFKQFETYKGYISTLADQVKNSRSKLSNPYLLQKILVDDPVVEPPVSEPESPEIPGEVESPEAPEGAESPEAPEGAESPEAPEGAESLGD